MLDAASADIGELVAQLYVEAAFSAAGQAALRGDGRPPALGDGRGDPRRRVDDRGDPGGGAARSSPASRYKIGYPDEWRDYSGLVIERGSYVENRMRCAAFEYARQMGRLGEPVDRGEWAMPAHVVNAYYHPLLNEIVFPAGILQPPFFYADADDAVNYGAIGAVIGHEITHGFDDQGSHFDAHGAAARLVDRGGPRRVRRGAPRCSWSSSTGTRSLDDLHVNGRLTLGENIADLGGLEDRLRRAARGARRQGRPRPSTGSTPSSGSSSRGRPCGARTTPTSTCT